MKVLIVGEGSQSVMEATQLAQFGYKVGHAATERFAVADFLKRSSVDLIVLVGCDRLEEADLVAERLKCTQVERYANVAPIVFVVWDGMDGFERGSDYGLQDIDILIEPSSIHMFEQAYRYARIGGRT